MISETSKILSRACLERDVPTSEIYDRLIAIKDMPQEQANKARMELAEYISQNYPLKKKAEPEEK